MSTESEPFPADIAEAAARWARRTTTGLSATERETFQAWMRADERHASAFAKLNRGDDCDWVWQAGAVDEVLVGLASRAHRRRRRAATGAFATAAVVVLAGGFWWQAAQSPSSNTEKKNATTLVVVRPERLSLPDGSIVELKDGARVTTDFTSSVRTITLDRGTAFFEVARDPSRPFVVRAGGLAVQAVGTAFAVDLAEREMTVLVTEGRVRVDQSPPIRGATALTTEPLASVGAGNSVVVPVAKPIATALNVRTVDSSELSEQTRWRIPKLEFTGTPLREVVDLMNAHSSDQLQLGDDSVGDLRVSGILRADKADVLVEMLESDFGVRTESSGATIVLRRGK